MSAIPINVQLVSCASLRTARIMASLEFPLIYMSGKKLVDPYAVKKFGPSVR